MSTSKSQLLRSAADHLARRPHATQDEIAAAAGVSRTTMHRHFPGRSTLIAALEELAIAEMHAVVGRARLDEDSATAALRRLIDECEPVSGYLSLLYTRSQELDMDQGHRWADIDTAVVALFTRGQRAGEFRPDLTATWLAEALFCLIAGAGWAVQLGRVARRDFAHMIGGLVIDGVSECVGA